MQSDKESGSLTATAAVASDIVARAVPGRVLIVDDEPAILRALTRVLGNAGYEVRSAIDGVHAKEILEREHFDVILSDVQMPGMDGLELLRFVRRIDLDVPIILISGASATAAVNEAVEAGALLYLMKPLDMRTLIQVADHARRLHQMAKLKRAALELGGKASHPFGDRAGLEVRFASAISSLWMAYQPIVLPSKREIFGYEALLRSSDPVLPDPGALLEAAERLGQLPELGRIIRERVAGAIDGAPPGPLIFVNLHPHDLTDPELFSAMAPLSRHAHRVVLEITERASLDDIKDVAMRITTLRKMGFQIAIDDLGAGYAGLTAFAQLQPEVVKLDMSLIRNLHDEPVKRKIVAAMTSLCKEMKILVVAEGVEVAEERDALFGLGCDVMQGYLFARPGKPFPTIDW